MATYIPIVFLCLTNIATAQIQLNIQQHCEPPLVKREIVSIDSLPVNHSFCIHIYKLDKQNRTVISSTVCDTSNGNTYFLFDTSQIGMQYDKYYDTTGKIIFESSSKNNRVLECYITFFYNNVNKLEYKEGYKFGRPIKISYEYDEYGNYSKEIIITPTK
jgi:hypothetical protein